MLGDSVHEDQVSGMELAYVEYIASDGTNRNRPSQTKGI
ncbi:hypothetical protein DSUL_90026 [Desulfovibrionales bacterium]